MIKKRIFDLVFVILGLLILWPLFVAISIWIKIDNKGPIFFRQKRVGRKGVVFEIFKFRTMVVNAECLGAKVTVGQDPRITPSGCFLRKYKIDELPQLLNILLGEMSLVGPRPEVPEYVAYWPKELYDIVLSVPPGITDLASIEFRDENELLVKAENPVEKYINEIIPIKLGYYQRYVNERNLIFDFWIILKTFGVVFRKS